MSIRQKKLCIVTPSHWAASFGGAEYQIKCLLDAMDKRKGFEIHYLARNLNPEFLTEKYTVHWVGNRYQFSRHSHLFDAPKLYSTLKQIAPDIIYQRMGCAYTGIAALYAKRFNCKMLWHVASDQDVTPLKINISKNAPFRYAERKALEYGIRNTSDIIVQTKQQDRFLKQHYNREANRIVANFHPVPPPPPPKNTQNQIIIVWIANLKPLKQPELFMDLAKKLGFLPKIRFIMIGRNSNWKWGHQLQKEISKASHLEYLGEQPSEKVHEVLAHADILVNTSQYEGFPNTFIQAWMRKVPVVSLNVNPDNILDEHGIGLSCSGNFAKLVQNVQLLVENAALRTSMGEKARNYALQNHSEKNADQIIDILEEKSGHD